MNVRGLLKTVKEDLDAENTEQLRTLGRELMADLVDSGDMALLLGWLANDWTELVSERHRLVEPLVDSLVDDVLASSAH